MEHTSSQQAARNAAQRRWDNALLKRFAGHPIYSDIVNAIDRALSDAATQIEMDKPGSGFWYVIEKLVEREIVSRSHLKGSCGPGDTR